VGSAFVKGVLQVLESLTYLDSGGLPASSTWSQQIPR
jgi:hypothetical protein